MSCPFCDALERRIRAQHSGVVLWDDDVVVALDNLAAWLFASATPMGLPTAQPSAGLRPHPAAPKGADDA